MYVFQLFDFYSASGLALLWVGCVECIAIGWVYGAYHLSLSCIPHIDCMCDVIVGTSRYYDNLEQMLGFRISPYMSVCWRFLTPCITILVFMWMWVQFEFLQYDNTYVYPLWGSMIGLCLAFSSMLCVPGYAFYAVLVAPGENVFEVGT